MNQRSKIVAQYSGRTFRQRNLFSLLNVSFCQQGHKLVFQNWLTAGELSWWGNKNVSPKIRLFFTLYNPSVDWSPPLGKRGRKSLDKFSDTQFYEHRVICQQFVDQPCSAFWWNYRQCVVFSSLPKRPSKKPW